MPFARFYNLAWGRVSQTRYIIMSIAAHFDQVIRLEPDQPAIEFKGDWYTWGELCNAIDGINSLLEKAGIASHQGVAMLLRNRPAHVAALLAGLIGRRCVVTINPIQPFEKVLKDIKKLRVPALIADVEDWQGGALRKLAVALGAVGIQIDDRLKATVLTDRNVLGPGPFHPPLQGVAIQMLTSGTTGDPKRVPLTRSTIDKALRAAMVYERDRHPDDPPMLRSGVSIVSSPLVHISGVFGVAGTIHAGRRICLMEKFSVDEWRDAMRRHKPKIAALVPAALRMVMDANLPKEDLASLIAVRSGTAPLPQELVDEVYERYGIPVLGTYGATEFAGGVAGWTYRDWKQHAREKRGSVGRLHQRIDARVVEEDTHRVLPAGSPGLLELRGGQLEDGHTWVRTTDLARIDEDRFLWILGRADNAIIRGGFKVLPGQVIEVLEAHPRISEAAVVGIRDRRLGQVPVAAYTLEDGLGDPGESELQQWIKARMTAYSVPLSMRCVKELPRTPSLKVSAVAVQALFSDLAEAQGSS